MASQRRSQNTFNGYLKASYQVSSSLLNNAEENLDSCDVAVSPGLTEMSQRISEARKSLQIIWERWRLNDSSQIDLPTSCGIFMRFFSPKQEDIDFRDLSIIETESRKLVKETAETTVRREGYQPLFGIIGRNNLPTQEDVSNASRASESLSPRDRVVVEFDVKVKEGSYLDSTKYRISGPKLIMLARKAINFIVTAQNPPERMKKLRSQLVETAKDIHRLTLKIAYDMRDAPDDRELHIKFMDMVNNVVDELLTAIDGPPRVFHAVATGSQRMLRGRERSLETLRNTRPSEQQTVNIQENRDHIMLEVNGKKHIHRIADLTWDYLQERVLPPMGVPIIKVENWRYHHTKASFAEIFSAQLPDGQIIALKRLLGSRSEPENVLCLRFIRELFIWWKAGDHPNVHRFLGICFRDHSNIPAMVSSWCGDGNLADHLRIPLMRFGRKEELKLALQVARGLRHLHSRDIVHGDLKTNNILLQNDQAKLYDFGISRIRTEAEGLSSQTHGNYAYQAPEVLKALRQPVRPHACATAKSDIYSFGCVLFECLTKQVPFDQLSSRTEIHDAVLKEFKRPLHPEYGVQVYGEGKDELVRLMKDCWHRDPAPRPSAEEVVMRLKEIERNIRAIDTQR